MHIRHAPWLVVLAVVLDSMNFTIHTSEGKPYKIQECNSPVFPQREKNPRLQSVPNFFEATYFEGTFPLYFEGLLRQLCHTTIR